MYRYAGTVRDGIPVTGTIVIYSSFSGKTRKTAQYIAKQLNADIIDLKLQTLIDLSAYNRVILGTGVHAGHPYGKLTKFYEANRPELKEKSVTLFVTCLYKGPRAGKQITDIAHGMGISDFTYFSNRGEKNGEGVSIDADAFVERIGL